MSYTVKLMAGASAAYTFSAPTPFIAPEYAYDYDDEQPPKLCQIHRTWILEGTLYGTAVPAGDINIVQSFLNLQNAIDGGSITGVELLQGPVGSQTTVLEVSQAAGYDSFKVQDLRALEDELQWRTKIRFRLRITATKKASGSISKLTQQESWSYDEAGLLTQTLTGEVVTTSGGSATAAAKTLGLTPPSAAFAYLTNGPGGVDVDQVDRGDTVARFRSSLRQAGQALPNGVGPSFSVSTRTTIQDGEQITTVTVSARGPNAKTAVQAQAPTGNFTLSDVAWDPYQLVATAQYVQRQPATGNVTLREQAFEMRGGGRPLKFTARSGGRSPLKHKGSFGPVEIRERLRIELVGSPGLNQFRYSGPVPGLDEDQSQFRTSGPRCIGIGKDASGDKWEFEVSRVYFADDYATALGLTAIYALSRRAQIGLTDPLGEASQQQHGTE